MEFDIPSCQYWYDAMNVYADDGISFVGGSTRFEVSVDPILPINDTALLYFKLCYSFNLTVSGTIGCVRNGTMAVVSHDWASNGAAVVVASVYLNPPLDEESSFIACGCAKVTVAGIYAYNYIIAAGPST